MCRDCGYDITVTLVCRGTDWVVTDVEPGDRRQQHYGLAVDYGSTMIVMQLVDLNSGAVVAEEKAVNGQTAYGTDILSRITYSLEDPAHADSLQQVTAADFDDLLSRLTESAGIDAAKCPVMIVSGNTTMIHFLLKLNAWTVFASPYAPVSTDPGFLWGRELGMDFDGLVYIIPSAAYTMVECLMETAGVTAGDLARCYLSGAFPAHSDLESAMTIGIFRDLPREKYTVLSNTSLDGARSLLLDRSRLREVHELAENIYCVQFASVLDFLVRMQAAKFIPHTDMSRYPSISSRLG